MISMLKDNLFAEGFQTKLIAEMIAIRFLRNFAKFVKLCIQQHQQC